MCEWNLQLAYLVTWDGDYNTLVHLFRERNVFGRVLIPHRDKASKLLKKAAGQHIQVLEELRYFIETKNPI
jgi:predicted NAD/FAD-binding protein